VKLTPNTAPLRRFEWPSRRVRGASAAVVVRALGLAGAVALWHLVAAFYDNPALLSPVVVMPELWQLLRSGDLNQHILFSTSYVMLGWGLASALAFGVGSMAALYAPVRWVVMPPLNAIRGVGALALYPLILLLFGIGLQSKVFIVAWTAWPSVLLNTVSSLERVPSTYREAARLETDNRWEIFYYVQCPLAFPGIWTGLQIGLSGAWISLVAAEMLGGNKGLGYFILMSSQTFKLSQMYGGVVVVAVIGLVFNLVLSAIALSSTYYRSEQWK